MSQPSVVERPAADERRCAADERSYQQGRTIFLTKSFDAFFICVHLRDICVHLRPAVQLQSGGNVRPCHQSRGTSMSATSEFSSARSNMMRRPSGDTSNR